MRLTMQEKKSLSKVFARKYRYATKLEKREILDEFIEYTGYNRNYAARVLRTALANETRKTKRKTRKRTPYYNEDVRKAYLGE